MGLKEDITSKVKEILNTNVDIEPVKYVPDINDKKLTFNGTGLTFYATVLYIDMRDSTEILNKHNKPTIAKIHKSYLYTTVKIATAFGGEVRSFNGDSVLAFFERDSITALNNAVKAAMKIRYMITNKDSGINEILAKYSAVDFGIGLDFGEVLCTKIGVGGDENTKDLIWIGNAVNRAVIISDECSSSEHIGISKMVYDNLTDDLKFHTTTNNWGVEQKTDMWRPYYVTYNGSRETFYKTSYWWGI